MARSIRRQRKQDPLSPVDYWGVPTNSVLPLRPPPKRRPITTRQRQRRVLVDEITSLRREVDRLREERRDTEKMEDEVWIKDGRIWFSHRCNGALLEQEISKGWRITSSGDITPSFACVACKAHFHATVIVQVRRAGWKKPADWEPRSTYSPYWPTQNWGNYLSPGTQAAPQVGQPPIRTERGMV